jgi:glycogen operon protein
VSPDPNLPEARAAVAAKERRDDTAGTASDTDASDPSTLDQSLRSFLEPERLGLVRSGESASFALHARARRSVVIELFEPGGERSFSSLELEPDPVAPEPWQIWVSELSGLPEDFEYVVRVDGGPPLLDPYAPLLAGGERWGESHDAVAPGVGRRYRALSARLPATVEPVPPPRLEAGRRVVYELHVRGFTRHPSSGVAAPGTYAGLIEKLPEIVDLGVTTVELMPVCEFDETENPRRHPRTGERLLNFWGYSPVSFFAPKAAYGSDPRPAAAAEELRELVRECHRAGIEVVLDMVFNHTAEGAGGTIDPVHSFRGLDAAAYYLLDAAGVPIDLTGCGNTVRVNHPVTRRLVIDALRHWVESYGVDGFRFDLAAVFFRGARAEKLATSPLLEAIAADPLLAGRLLIAEPWDATGFAPADGFPAPWLEWDGEFRDAVRRYVGGLETDPRPVARRMAGYGPRAGHTAERSLRFVACHDGRPLADVVAWSTKHNDGNGEANHDGWNGEVAWNGGEEGPTTDANLQARREREIRMLMALGTLAPGTLQLTAGDERLRSQGGNTNAWCQDNEIGWLDWTPGADAEELRQLVRRLLRLRADLLAEPEARRLALLEPFTDSTTLAGGGPDSGFVLVAANEGGEAEWMIAVNPGTAALRFPLPSTASRRRWRLRLDTGRPPGQEVFAGEEAPFLAYETSYLAVAPRSLRLLRAEAMPMPSRNE